MILCRLVALFIELFYFDFILFFSFIISLFFLSIFLDKLNVNSFSVLDNFVFLSSLVLPVKSLMKLKIVGDSEGFGITSLYAFSAGRHWLVIFRLFQNSSNICIYISLKFAYLRCVVN